MTRIKFDDYDEYEEMYDDLLEEKRNSKLHTKGSKKRKGHQSVHNKKAEMHQEFLDSFSEEWDDSPKFIPPKPASESKNYDKNKFKKTGETRPLQPKFSDDSTTEKRGFGQARNTTFGVNSHEVKGNLIDFDRVENIEKIDSNYNGRQTYGIKFLFTGKKGLFKTIWFNQNVRERDSVYNKEFGFWKNLQNNKC